MLKTGKYIAKKTVHIFKGKDTERLLTNGNIYEVRVDNDNHKFIVLDNGIEKRFGIYRYINKYLEKIDE